MIDIDFAFYFQHCRWDNPCFQMGMFWFVVFLGTGAITLHYKIQDLAEAEANVKAQKQATEKKAREESAMASAASQEPAVIKEENVEEDGAVADAAVSEPSKQQETNVTADIPAATSQEAKKEESKTLVQSSADQ